MIKKRLIFVAIYEFIKFMIFIRLFLLPLKALNQRFSVLLVAGLGH